MKLKYFVPLNKTAKQVLEPSDDNIVHAQSPLPAECSTHYAPGMEVGADKKTGINLCNPFLSDTVVCSGVYWPAQRPDGDVLNSPNTNKDWDAYCSNFQNDWQKLPPTIPIVKNGINSKFWDTADKSDASRKSDIWIRDSFADTGSGCNSPYWLSPDIFFRNNRDDPNNFNNIATDYNQNPIAGKENWMYIRVSNNGNREIDHFFGRFYICTPWSSNPNWQEIGHVDGHNLGIGQVQTVMAPLPYIPSAAASHSCITAWVESTQDNLNINFGAYNENTGPRPVDMNISCDNNVAQKNIKIVAAAAGFITQRIPFSLGTNIVGKLRGVTTLQFNFENIPTKGNLFLALPTLKANQIKEAQLDEVVTGLHIKELVKTIPSLVKRELYQFLAEPGSARNPKGFVIHTVNTATIRDIPVTFEKNKDLMGYLNLLTPECSGFTGTGRIHISQFAGDKQLGGITLEIKFRRPEHVRIFAEIGRKKYHLNGCNEIRKIDRSILVPFDSEFIAESEGFKPALCCRKK